MKNSLQLVTLIILGILSFNSKAQTTKAEVFYFKADLPCCQGKACNLLEADVRIVVQKLYPNGEVEFKVVKLSDPSNKALVDKYSAKSQTVIIFTKNKKKEKSLDISDIVRNYNTTKDMVVFESAMKNKFNEILK